MSNDSHYFSIWYPTPHDEVTSAITSINDNSTDYIQLNDVELKEINEILNQTKSDIQLNQLLKW